MKKIVMTGLILMGFAVPSMAQDHRTLCRVVEAYTGADAAFVPGVDARGRAVAPADVTTPVRMSGGVVRMPLTVDLAQRLNMPVGTELRPVLGFLEVHPDGTVLFDGQDISGNVNTVCKTAGGAKFIPASDIPTTYGRRSPEPTPDPALEPAPLLNPVPLDAMEAPPEQPAEGLEALETLDEPIFDRARPQTGQVDDPPADREDPFNWGEGY